MRWRGVFMCAQYEYYRESMSGGNAEGKPAACETRIKLTMLAVF
jgi:hypothetical protein